MLLLVEVCPYCGDTIRHIGPKARVAPDSKAVRGFVYMDIYYMHS